RCPSRQVIEALLIAIDLAAIVVFQGDADACHRETSWVFACLTRGKSTLACVFMLCPVPSPKNLQEDTFCSKLREKASRQTHAKGTSFHRISLSKIVILVATF